jgi:hypothetical protein
VYHIAADGAANRLATAFHAPYLAGPAFADNAVSLLDPKTLSRGLQIMQIFIITKASNGFLWPDSSNALFQY